MCRAGFVWVTLIFASVLLTLASCEKRVTPHKVERILTKDSWKVTSFIYMDTNVTAAFGNQTLGFGDGGSLSFLNSNGVTGHWSLSSGKNPTILYITGILIDPYTAFSDNWEVKTCKKDKVTMSADHGSYVNSLELEKVAY